MLEVHVERSLRVRVPPRAPTSGEISPVFLLREIMSIWALDFLGEDMIYYHLFSVLGAVAQLDRASDYESEGCGFDSRQPRQLRRHQIAGWSSLVARQAHNLKVVGSNPAPATNSIWCTPCRTVAQPGSAFAWGAKGHEFKSRRSDQKESSAASQWS